MKQPLLEAMSLKFKLASTLKVEIWELKVHSVISCFLSPYHTACCKREELIQLISLLSFEPSR